MGVDVRNHLAARWTVVNAYVAVGGSYGSAYRPDQLMDCPVQFDGISFWDIFHSLVMALGNYEGVALRKWEGVEEGEDTLILIDFV